MNEQLNKENPLFQLLDSLKKKMPEKEFNKFKKKVQTELINKVPTVAVIGKAGVGKTTTIINLFDADSDVADNANVNPIGSVGDVKRGTTEAIRKHYYLKKIGMEIDVIDLPGLGDDLDNDAKFEKLYLQILPQSDIVLFIMKADNRTIGEDERILHDIVLPVCDKKKLIVAINQVDLLGQNEGLCWDTRINLPDERQLEMIRIKQKNVASVFHDELNIETRRIVCYSALKRYNLLALLEVIVNATPSGFVFGALGLTPKSWLECVEPEWKEKLEMANYLYNNKQ